MIGLLFLLAFGIYLAVSVWIVKATIRWARKNGRGVKRWGIAAALFMYLLVFWDHIPTLLLHKYYCATKAGFWVYKTPEKWKKENPGVAKTLTWSERSTAYDAPGIIRGYRLNERFVWGDQVKEVPLLPVRLVKESVIDTKTNEAVIERVYVGSGYRGGKQMLRFWTSLGPCIKNGKDFSHYRRAFERMGREVK